MLDRCANPQCAAPFNHKEEGRFFAGAGEAKAKYVPIPIPFNIFGYAAAAPKATPCRIATTVK